MVQGVGACGKKLQKVCFALILPLGGEPCATGAGASVAKQWRPVPLLSALLTHFSTCFKLALDLDV